MKSLALVTSNDDLVTKQYCDNNFVKINELISNFNELTNSIFDPKLGGWDLKYCTLEQLEKGIKLTATGDLPGATRIERLEYLEQGTYTLSLKFFGDIKILLWDGTDFDSMSDKSDGDWKILTKTFKVLKDGMIPIRFYFNTGNRGDEIKLAWAKIEKGTIATRYVPSLKDFDLRLKEIEKKLNI